MSTFEKLIKKVFANSAISYSDAEKILLKLGFQLNIEGSHHVFRKNGYLKTISLKKRKQLLPYQIRMLREVLIKHEYEI